MPVYLRESFAFPSFRKKSRGYAAGGTAAISILEDARRSRASPQIERQAAISLRSLRLCVKISRQAAKTAKDQ